MLNLTPRSPLRYGEGRTKTSLLIRWRDTLALLLLMVSAAFAQTPDPRDSVIIEEKLVPGGFTGNPAFVVKIYITNKDSLANFTLPLKFWTWVGSAFVVLDTPRTFDGTINRLTSTLGNNRTFSDFTDGASPDTALWASFWNQSNRATAERPNSFRKAFWEIRFGGSSGGGDALMDSAIIFDNRVAFVGVNGNTIGVNFKPGVLHVLAEDINITNCSSAGGNVLYGRQYSYDFNTDISATWAVGIGPGSINSNGVYTFSGQCSLGVIPVQVEATSPGGYRVTCYFTLNIIDNPPSCSPAQSVVTVSHGQMATNQFNGSDPDAGDTILFSKLSGPGSVNANGAWSYATSCSDVGLSPRTIQIQTNDAYSSCSPGPLADTTEFQLVVTNAVPGVTNCPTDVVPVDSGAPFSLQLSGADIDPADAGNLSFFLVSAPAGFSVSSSGLVQWTPAGSQWGLRTATVQVRDLCGAFGNCQINFAVAIRKGDLNGDGRIFPADLSYLLNAVFLGLPPPAGLWACDLNCDGRVAPADIILLIQEIFLATGFPC